MTLFKRRFDDSPIVFHCLELSDNEHKEIKESVEANGGVMGEGTELQVIFMPREKYKNGVYPTSCLYDIDYIRTCAAQSKLLNSKPFRLGEEKLAEDCIMSAFMFGSCYYKNMCLEGSNGLLGPKLTITNKETLSEETLESYLKNQPRPNPDSQLNGNELQIMESYSICETQSLESYRTAPSYNLPISESPPVVRYPYMQTLLALASDASRSKNTRVMDDQQNQELQAISNDASSVESIQSLENKKNQDSDCSGEEDVKPNLEQLNGEIGISEHNHNSAKSIMPPISDDTEQVRESQVDLVDVKIEPEYQIWLQMPKRSVTENASKNVSAETSDSQEATFIEMSPVRSRRIIRKKPVQSSALRSKICSMRGSSSSDENDDEVPSSARRALPLNGDEQLANDRLPMIRVNPAIGGTFKSTRVFNFLHKKNARLPKETKESQLTERETSVHNAVEEESWNKPGSSGLRTQKTVEPSQWTSVQRNDKSDEACREPLRRHAQQYGNQELQNSDEDNKISDRDEATNVTRPERGKVKQYKRARKTEKSILTVTGTEAEEERRPTVTQSKGSHQWITVARKPLQGDSSDEDSMAKRETQLSPESKKMEKRRRALQYAKQWRWQLEANSQPIQRNLSYTEDERRSIVNYLLSFENLDQVCPKGLKVWGDMAKNGYMTHRTPQSLQNHFVKYILPKIETYFNLMNERQQQQFLALKRGNRR